MIDCCDPSSLQVPQSEVPYTLATLTGSVSPETLSADSISHSLGYLATVPLSIRDDYPAVTV